MNGLKTEIKDISVAIPIIGDKNWMGGVTYIHYLINALSFLENNKPKIYLVFRDRNLEALKLHEDIFPLLDGLIYVGNDDIEIGHEFIQCLTYDELAQITDVFFPVVLDSLKNRVSISWIPDFQHKHLPHMFSKEESSSRDSNIKEISNSGGVVLLSSNDSLRDYETFYPLHNTLTKVMPFYLVPPEEWYIEDTNLLEMYNLNQDFFICSNQLWKHKNHLTLIKAIKRLKEEGIEIQVVLTGAKKDDRFPEYFTELINYIDKYNLNNNIKILGLIPRVHQIYLMRKSIAVIQPSLFEGWGTVLEDSRAFGKTIILSDIAVHKEQETDYSIFFEATSSEDLSSKVKYVFLQKEKHLSLVREKKARLDAITNAEKYAQNFVEIIYSAYLYYKSKEGFK